MATFIMLTRLGPGAAKSSDEVKRLEKAVDRKIERECPGVTWQANFAILGPYDYMDVFDAEDEAVAAKVAMIVRSAGHAQTETWSALTWERYKTLISS
jgi:uncharacterized protein with GYD domain